MHAHTHNVLLFLQYLLHAWFGDFIDDSSHMKQFEDKYYISHLLKV